VFGNGSFSFEVCSLGYRGRSRSGYGLPHKGSKYGAHGKKGKSESSDLRTPIGDFIQADLADETSAGPEYREQADMLEAAGFPQEAMWLRFIASQEDSHKQFFEELKNRGLG
jgi:rubrerythrin